MEQRYALRVITPPLYEPISLAETKRHLRIDDDLTADDDDILGYIEAAREWLEGFTARVYVQETLEMSIDCWPGLILRLPRSPVLSVDSIKYTDANGVEQTWAASNYQTDLASEPARVAIAYLGTFPSSLRGDLNQWRVRFTAGYAVGSPNGAEAYRENVPRLAKMAMKLYVMGMYDGTLDVLKKTAEATAWPLRASFL